MIEALCALAGAAVGGIITWLVCRQRSAVDRARLATQLEESQKRIEEQRAHFEAAQKKFEESFKGLAGDALRSNNEVFIKLAEQTLKTHITEAERDAKLRKKSVEELFKPIQEALKKTQERAYAMEKERRMKELGVAGGKELPDIKPVDKLVREAKPPEV